MNCPETVTVNLKAVNWLKEKYPVLCIKAGLCEQIGGRLYTKTHYTTPPAVQPESEPVGEFVKADYGDYPVLKWNENYIAKIGDKFYTHPKEWQDLTDEQMLDEVKRIDPDEQYWSKDLARLARAIEAKLRSKNT